MIYPNNFYAALIIGLIFDCIRSVCRLADVNPLALLILSGSALVAYGFALFYLFKSRGKREKS